MNGVRTPDHIDLHHRTMGKVFLYVAGGSVFVCSVEILIGQLKSRIFLYSYSLGQACASYHCWSYKTKYYLSLPHSVHELRDAHDSLASL